MEPQVKALPLVQQALADPRLANFALEDLRDDLKEDLVDFPIELAINLRLTINTFALKSLITTIDPRTLAREILQIIADNIKLEHNQIIDLIGQSLTNTTCCCFRANALQFITDFWREVGYPEELYDNSYPLKDALVHYLQSADLYRHLEFLIYIQRKIHNKWSQSPQSLTAEDLFTVGFEALRLVPPEQISTYIPTTGQLVNTFLYIMTHNIHTRHLTF